MMTPSQAHSDIDMSILKDLWLVESINGDVANVICNAASFSVPLSALPKGIRDGDVFELRLQNGELLKRKEEIVKLFNSLKDN